MILRKSKITKSPQYPSIAPVPEGVHRPFWSVMIPTYNCANYLAETLKSVLEQDPGTEEMQIEVVDNCSTKDDPEAVVKEIGQGRVSFFRQPQNVGAIRNFNTCIQRARGYWLHILHGDDLVMQNFYLAYKDLITLHADATLLISPSVLVDDNGRTIGVASVMPSNNGIVSDFARLQAIQNWIQTPTVVVPRHVYEKFGGFREDLSHTADWEMWFRSGFNGKVITLSKPHTFYRIHSGSDTSRLVLSGENIRQSIQAVNICLAQLPQQVQREIAPKKYYWSSLQAANFTRKLAIKKKWKSSLIQAYLAMKLSPQKKNIKLFIKAGAKYILARFF